jgi:hypothetical protein
LAKEAVDLDLVGFDTIDFGATEGPPIDRRVRSTVLDFTVLRSERPRAPRLEAFRRTPAGLQRLGAVGEVSDARFMSLTSPIALLLAPDLPRGGPLSNCVESPEAWAFSGAKAEFFSTSVPG